MYSATCDENGTLLNSAIHLYSFLFCLKCVIDYWIANRNIYILLSTNNIIQLILKDVIVLKNLIRQSKPDCVWMMHRNLKGSKWSCCYLTLNWDDFSFIMHWLELRKMICTKNFHYWVPEAQRFAEWKSDCMKESVVKLWSWRIYERIE